MPFTCAADLPVEEQEKRHSRFLESQRRRAQTYRQRKQADPEFVARERERCRLNYQRRCEDPEFVERERARRKAYYARKRAERLAADSAAESPRGEP